MALPIYVLKLTGSAAATSGVVAAAVAPSLLLGLVAGVFVDRWDRRRLMVVTNMLQGVALLPLVVVDSANRLWIVYAVVFISSALAQFFAPAENALLPRLVDESELPAANSLNALNNNIARLIGPTIGGVLATTVGLVGVSLVDAASFVAAAGLIALIRGRFIAVPETAPPVRRALFQELGEGFGAIARSRVTQAILLMLAIAAIGEGVIGSVFPIFVTGPLKGDAPELGWLMSAQAVGGILGGLTGAAVGRRLTPARMVTLSVIAFGTIDLIIFNYPRWFSAIGPELVLFAVVGVPGALAFAGLMTLLQTEVSDAVLGRVFAAALVIEALATLAGAGLAAAFTARVGVLNMLTVQGSAYLVAGIAFAAMARRPRDVRAIRPGAVPVGAAGDGYRPYE